MIFSLPFLRVLTSHADVILAEIEIVLKLIVILHLGAPENYSTLISVVFALYLNATLSTPSLLYPQCFS